MSACKHILSSEAQKQKSNKSIVNAWCCSFSFVTFTLQKRVQLQLDYFSIFVITNQMHLLNKRYEIYWFFACVLLNHLFVWSFMQCYTGKKFTFSFIIFICWAWTFSIIQQFFTFYWHLYVIDIQKLVWYVKHNLSTVLRICVSLSKPWPDVVVRCHSYLLNRINCRKRN